MQRKTKLLALYLFALLFLGVCVVATARLVEFYSSGQAQAMIDAQKKKEAAQAYFDQEIQQYKKWSEGHTILLEEARKLIEKKYGQGSGIAPIPLTNN